MTDLAASPTAATGDYLPKPAIAEGLRGGRNVYEGYQRGWGLQHGKLADKIKADPMFAAASKVAAGRSITHWPKLMNLYLILKFYLPKVQGGDIVEFGSFRGGGAMFMAHVARALYPQRRIYALDTFEGMPPTDPTVDQFKQNSFSNVDFAEVQGAVEAAGLHNVELCRGLFEDTAEGVLKRSSGVALAHIDCDIYSSAVYAYDAIKPHLVPGAYVVFDDATESGCIGATEAVEKFVIARDGKLSEQIYPHFVFRHW